MTEIARWETRGGRYWQAGDEDMVALCDRALLGDESAQRECIAYMTKVAAEFAYQEEDWRGSENV